jgi:TPR repeat protein
LKAAENGLAEAQYMMGFIYDFGECGISCDKAKAKKWYELAAEQGNQYAIERLYELS